VTRPEHSWKRLSRRALLGSIGVGGAGLLAGCEGLRQVARNRTRRDGRGALTDTLPRERLDRSRFEGPTLLWSLGTNASDVTWFGTGAYPGTDGIYVRPRGAWDMTMVPELWGPWVNEPIRSGDVQYGLYESVQITPEELTIHVREDATWSNGDPVLGQDAVPVTVAARLATGRPLDVIADRGPARPIEAITGVEFDGKVARFLSDGGWFEDFIEYDVLALVTRKATAGGQGGVWQHTRIDPYEAWFDGLLDLWHQTTSGAIDPWSEAVDLWAELDAALPAPPGRSWPAYFRDPSHCVVTGAFRPAEIGSSAIVLERNPEFYAADRVAIEHVVFDVQVPDVTVPQAHAAALNAGPRDYLRGPIPAPVAEKVPDGIEQRQIPAPTGLALAVNHWTRPFDAPAVRQAVMYALDTASIATNVHRTRYVPVTTPGGDAFRSRELLGDAFVEETLTTYEHDPEAATERMRSAGFSRENGTWVDSDGAPAEFVVKLPSTKTRAELSMSTPEMTIAASVADQLTDFGLDVRWMSLSPTIFEEQREAHQLTAWPTQYGVGFALPAVGKLYLTLVERASRAKLFGTVSRSQVEAAGYESGILPRDELGGLSVEAPPVGEPDGALESWHAPRLARECVRTGSPAAYVDTLRQLAWLYNWHLPVFPIAHGHIQHFFDTANWEWPDLGSESYDGVGVAQLQPEDLVALGLVRPE